MLRISFNGSLLKGISLYIWFMLKFSLNVGNFTKLDFTK